MFWDTVGVWILGVMVGLVWALGLWRCLNFKAGVLFRGLGLGSVIYLGLSFGKMAEVRQALVLGRGSEGQGTSALGFVFHVRAEVTSG